MGYSVILRHKIMKKFSRLLGTVFVAVAFLLFSKSDLIAATLTLTSVGGTEVGVLITVATDDTTPTLIGTASPEATVDITIDDLTVAVLADDAGGWSYTPSTALTVETHSLELASNLESLQYILIINGDGSESTTSTTTTTTTTTTNSGIGGATESSGTTLPVSGGVENTFLMVVGGLFLMGLGLATQQLVPAINESEDTYLEQDLTEEVEV